METKITRRETPEESELRKKLEELAEFETELTQRELDLATLKSELRAFEVLYLRTVGIKYAELDEIRAQIGEIRARMNPVDGRAQDEATQARARARESAEAAGQVGGQEHMKSTPSDDLKKLYREIAKRIHPDLAEDEAERDRRNDLMSEANRAYEEGNENRLRAILTEWESSPESVKGDGFGADLVRVIRKIAKIQKRLSDLEKEISDIRDSELHQLRIKSEDAKKLSRDILAEMVETIEQEIGQARAELAGL